MREETKDTITIKLNISSAVIDLEKAVIDSGIISSGSLSGAGVIQYIFNEGVPDSDLVGIPEHQHQKIRDMLDINLDETGNLMVGAVKIKKPWWKRIL